LPEQIGDQLDGRGDPRHHRVAVLCVADRVLADVREPQRAELPQQQHPRAEGAGNARREQPGAGNEIEAQRAVVRDRRSVRSRSLPAHDDRLVALGAVKQDRYLAARPVEMRLDDLQRQAGRHSSIEGVAALLEHCHSDGRT
jgi:hypothetical protein